MVKYGKGEEVAIVGGKYCRLGHKNGVFVSYAGILSCVVRLDRGGGSANQLVTIRLTSVAKIPERSKPNRPPETTKPSGDPPSSGKLAVDQAQLDGIIQDINRIREDLDQIQRRLKDLSFQK